jgi:hypothetical protein
MEWIETNKKGFQGCSANVVQGATPGMSNPAEQQGYCAEMERDWTRRPAELDAVRLREPAHSGPHLTRPAGSLSRCSSASMNLI